MAMDHPGWLDAHLVQKVLRTAEKDESIEVSNTIVKPATAKGDNYSSEMYRAAVQFSRVQDGHKIQEQISLIVKVAPQDDVRREMIVETGIFETEHSVMSVTLPMMNQSLERFGFTPLSARCLHIAYEQPMYMVIEDLAPRGFRMADRHAGLDLDHSLLVIQNLGRFHAASIALKEKDPKAWTNYEKWMFHKDQSPACHRFFNSSGRNFANEIAEWSEISPCIKNKVSKLSEVLFEKGCEAALYREDDFNVLNHGDCWVNNMLFRYDEERKPIDHVFLDFQISHYGSPAHDLLYFFGTSPTDDVRLHHREFLLKKYHVSLVSTMAKLECETKVLNFEALQDALKKRAFIEVAAAMTALPIVLLEKGEEIDIEELLKLDGEFNNVGFRGRMYRKIMTRLLPLFDSMGLLDV